MTGLRLKHAADYVRRGRASRMFLALLAQIKGIFTFRQERSNRLARFVAITRSYKAGMAVAEIEEKYGCSKQTVLRYARFAGLPRRPHYFPADIKAAVLADYRRSNPRLSVAQIAALHDVSSGYVSTVAKQAGVGRYEARPGKVRRARRRKRGEAGT